MTDIPPSADTSPSDVSVVAHRGSSKAFGEHTLEAYVDAIEAGADALECDVRLTADAHLVLVHDPTVERVSDGRGRVSTMTLEQLRRLRWGSAGDAPMTLHQLFELVRDCGRPVQVAVETKHPTRYGPRTEEALCDLMDRFGWLPPGDQPAHLQRFTSPTPVRVMSFAPVALRRVAARSPRTPLVQLLDKPHPMATRARLPGGAYACGIDVALLAAEPSWVQAVRAAGHELHVWTVDDERLMDDCVAAGARAIITNRPATALARIGRRPARSRLDGGEVTDP